MTHTDPNDEEWEAYLRVRDKINPARPELKLRGKTYPVRLINTPIACRIIDLCREDKILFAMLMQAVQDTLETPNVREVLDEQADDLMFNAVEAGLAQALMSIRKGTKGLDELGRGMKRATREQAAAHEEMKTSEDWTLIKDKFGISSLADKENEEKEDEGYHGGIYI